MAIRANFEGRAVALAGPTASGKSTAAIALAQEYGAEIVSVDSALVYRGMDVGTAKPTAAERAAVVHHLIDIRDPADPYSAAEFAADAQRLVRQINDRGRLALLVGGTMLYFKALFEGLDAMPRADPAVRAQLEAQAAAQGWPALHAQLSQIDAVTAARLAPNDSQRIQRALEVFHISGRPLSSFHAQGGGGIARAWEGVAFFSLEPVDRAWLHQRIARRFDAMLAAGFLDEMKTLRGRGDLKSDLPSMRCVGYRQAWELLEQHQSKSADARFPIEQLREKGIFATRQLAKRQLTWLRARPDRQVIPCDAPDAIAQLLKRVGAAL